MTIRIGCQLNCWPVGPTFDEPLAEAIREAGEIGYVGVESNWCMIDVWESRRTELADLLAASGTVISALFFGAGSAETTAAKQELDDAMRTAAFLESFGADRMMIGGGKATDDDATFKAVCDHYSELGRRVYEEHGVKACYHLHGGAIASSPDEIKCMLELTDPRYWFLCPDSGIMVKEGHDVIDVCDTCFDRIGYVHFKDWTGADGWSMLGQGVVDHVGIIAKLEERGYDGWIISENESRTKGLSPREQQGADREWLRSQGV